MNGIYVTAVCQGGYKMCDFYTIKKGTVETCEHINAAGLCLCEDAVEEALHEECYAYEWATPMKGKTK